MKHDMKKSKVYCGLCVQLCATMFYGGAYSSELETSLVDAKQYRQLRSAIHPDACVRKNCPYIIDDDGFRVAQCYPEEHGVLLKCDKPSDEKAAMALWTAIAGEQFTRFAPDSEGENCLCYVRDLSGEFVSGQTMRRGVFVYYGTETFRLGDGSTITLKGFRPADEKTRQSVYSLIAKANESQKKKEQEDAVKNEHKRAAERERKERCAPSVPIPEDFPIRSICGIRFGEPPHIVRQCVGESQIFTVGLYSRERFKLKKSFRVFDLVEPAYCDSIQGYCVLERLKFIGYVDLKKISESACLKELQQIRNLLAVKFKLDFIGKDGGSRYSAIIGYGKTKINDGAMNEISLSFSNGTERYNTSGDMGEFILEIEVPQMTDLIYLHMKEVKASEEEKKSDFGFSEQEGADVL